MFDVIRRFFIGPPDTSGLEAQDAPKTTWKNEARASFVADVATGCLNTGLVLGTGTRFRGKIFVNSLLALCCGQTSKADRFRLNARMQNVPERQRESMRSIIRATSFCAESARNILLGVCNVGAFEKRFGEGLAHFIKVGVDQFYPVEGTFSKVIPTLAISSCGFSLAALLDDNKPEISRALRVISVAHAIYGIFPEYIGPLAEQFVGHNYDLLTFYEFSLIIPLATTTLSILSADDRKGIHTPESVA